MRDKRGEEKVFSLWWFILVVFVVGSVVIVTIGFTSKDFDVREISAEVLYNRLAECVIQNGYLSENFEVGDSYWELYETCHLEGPIFENGEGYYFEILFDGEEKFLAGDKSFKETCRIKQELNFVDSPGCAMGNETVYYIDAGSDLRVQGDLTIIAISNQELNSKFAEDVQ